MIRTNHINWISISSEEGFIDCTVAFFLTASLILYIMSVIRNVQSFTYKRVENTPLRKIQCNDLKLSLYHLDISDKQVYIYREQRREGRGLRFTVKRRRKTKQKLIHPGTIVGFYLQAHRTVAIIKTSGRSEKFLIRGRVARPRRAIRVDLA